MRTIRFRHAIAVALCLMLNTTINAQDKDLAMTKDNSTTDASIPRPEHPRPQFERSEWLNLNGQWAFEIDEANSGIDRNLPKAEKLKDTITVPFCPESKESGVAHTDFMNSVWYQKFVQIPSEWKGKRILLHFGAVDYIATLYVDGKEIARHVGGSSPFDADVTQQLGDAQPHNVVLHAEDYLRDGHQPSGKQSTQFNSYGCFYTRTTGIWQTVWMEATDRTGLKNVQIIPNFDSDSFSFIPEFYDCSSSHTLRVTVTDPETHASAKQESKQANGAVLTVAIKNPKPWEPGHPFLYDVAFEVVDENGKVIDTVKSYAGMRKVHTENGKVYINNKPFFLRLVLDQGFYPTGIWTAPTDKALQEDIQMSMKAGFNGARLHQKVFEERFHYHADKLGYLTWGEMPSWGTRPDDELGARNMLDELGQVILRDRNHPSIIAWTPWNEHFISNREAFARTMENSYALCHALDPSRPVNDSSGWIHVKTDLYTAHNYEQNPGKLDEEMAWNDENGGVYRNYPNENAAYAGQPYILDEFGGIKWVPEDRRTADSNAWGYGDAPQTIDEYYERLQGMVTALNKHPHIAGWCFTQLTDVEQENNGIYNYDRTLKFDMKRINDIFSTPAQAFDMKD